MYAVILPASVLIGMAIGLIGIGGGVLLVPLLLYFNFSVQEAVAISLFLNAVPNTIPAVWMYYKRGHLQVKAAVLIAIATIVGIVLGGYVGSRGFVSDVVVYRIYTVMLFVAGAFTLTRCGVMWKK